MNYSETLKYLFDCLPVYHKVGSPAYKEGLYNAYKLDDYFKSPHKSFPAIHVAGTNGKGSVSHMLASVLQTAGYKTGLFTSPHLIDFRERIRVNGQMIPEDYVSEFVTKYFGLFQELHPSFFELTVFLAFQYFKDQRVDVAIIETGLGGRLDTTNIITPIISVITNIGNDHAHILGNNLQQIAFEKAGIMKVGVPVVIGKKQPFIAADFIQYANSLKCPIYFSDDLYKVEIINDVGLVMKQDKIIVPKFIPGLKGYYQRENIPVVFQVFDLLPSFFSVSIGHIIEGIERVVEKTGLMGRWQLLQINPQVICDIGHNADGVREVIGQIKLQKFKHLHIVFGLVADKALDEIFPLLPDFATYYFTKANLPRSLSEDILMEYATKYQLRGEKFRDVKSAVLSAKTKANKDDLIFIGGSNFVVAEALLLF